MSTSSFPSRRSGQLNTKSFRVWFEKNAIPCSPWHDIPLYANPEQTILNMIVEIPRWTNAKYEISRSEYLNPIKQDTKNGEPRYVRNRFPFKGYMWNYGAFPQTWEDPTHIFPETQTHGDRDPLDACEIGEQVAYVGQIKQVKILGLMLLLDEGETDWKIFVIDVNDPLSSKLNDIEDIETHCPGLLRESIKWFKYYKVPDGKAVNEVAFGGTFKNREYATEIVRECAKAWDGLIARTSEPEAISLVNATNAKSPHITDTRGKLDDLLEEPETSRLSPMKGDLEKWFHLPESVTQCSDYFWTGRAKLDCTAVL